MLLKRCLLGFWAVWYALVFATNLVELLNFLGTFQRPLVRVASGNFRLLQETTARYEVAREVNLFLFAGVLALEALSAFLFAYACLSLRRREHNAGRVAYPAFTVSLLLWAGFMIADEVFLAYALEGTHMRIFIAQLASLLVLYLVPEHTDLPPAEPG